MGTFERLLERLIFSYLFCFNPEPDSRMAAHPKSSVRRWRRVQLAKFLLEECGLEPPAFDYDDSGALARIHAPPERRAPPAAGRANADGSSSPTTE